MCAVKGAGRTGRGEGGRGLLGRPAGTQPRSLAVPAQSSPSVAPGRWAALGRRSARTARWSQAVSTGPLPGRTFPGRPGFCGPQAHGDMEFGLPRPPECTLWCMPLCAHPCVWPVPPAPETATPRVGVSVWAMARVRRPCRVPGGTAKVRGGVRAPGMGAPGVMCIQGLGEGQWLSSAGPGGVSVGLGGCRAGSPSPGVGHTHTRRHMAQS